MPLDALLFDLDGTLVDTNMLHVEAWRQAFEQLGYRVPSDRIFLEIGKGGDHVVKDLIGKEADERDGDALRKAEPERFGQLAKQQGVGVMPGAVELLTEVRRRGLRIALCTGSSPTQLKDISTCSKVDWLALVDVATTSEDAKVSKPSPDVVTAAVKKLNLSPAQCALVGDTAFDALAARDAGVVCLGLECGGHTSLELRQMGARATWKDPAALLSDLDRALKIAAPGELRLTSRAMETLMRRALEAAEEGLAAGEAPIGCVVARGDGEVLASGFNSLNGTLDRTAHAEIVALRKAAGRYPNDATDLLVVSTLEPCVMCLGAVMESAVDTVLYGLPAPADGGTRRVQPPLSPEARMPRIVRKILPDPARVLFEKFLRKPNLDPAQEAFTRHLLKLTEQE